MSASLLAAFTARVRARWPWGDLEIPSQSRRQKDFFKGALQKVEARRRRSSGSGEMVSTTKSEK
jgi:hypothetical protein